MIIEKLFISWAWAVCEVLEEIVTLNGECVRRMKEITNFRFSILRNKKSTKVIIIKESRAPGYFLLEHSKIYCFTNLKCDLCDDHHDAVIISLKFSSIFHDSRVDEKALSTIFIFILFVDDDIEQVVKEWKWGSENTKREATIYQWVMRKREKQRNV